MSETTRNVHRAAMTAILYELDRAGYLEGLTLQKIADLLHLGHRSTALRYLRDVESMRELIPQIRAAIPTLPMKDGNE